ncbi:uncharacterized protein LOC117518145 [Thalassophryne amazonica]|uniref:uncharacterized protein LOC117518145 n=1 Tax=Thalassophryne amazonica TaxID=390379 RepID=UPI001470B1FD|nr:uncharacterized protein LOC117518145 [Thalassophryne amazonica]
MRPPMEKYTNPFQSSFEKLCFITTGKRLWQDANAGLGLKAQYVKAVYMGEKRGLVHRIKEKCREWGPACLSENLKLENSIAVKLLEDSTAEPTFWVIHSDPSLSLIEEISEEQREDMYPVVHTQAVPLGSGQLTDETTGVVCTPETLLSHRSLEHVCYKPHTCALLLYEEESKEMEEEQGDVPAGDQDGRCMFEGKLHGLLCSVQVDFSSEWSSEDNTDTHSVDLQQSVSAADTRLTGKTILTGGYFPQGPAMNSTTA